MHYEKFADGSVKCIEDEIPFELPEGWAWCRISSIANFLGGYAYKSNKYVPESQNMIIRIGNVKNNKLNPYIAQTCISDEYALETQDYKICVGDILFTMTGTKGKRDYFFSCLIKEDDIEGMNLFLNQRVGCLRLVDNTKIVAEYLVSSIQSTNVLDAIFATETGNVNQGNIGSAATLNLLVPIPPTNEQDRISKKLYEILTCLNKHDLEIKELEEIVQNIKNKILDFAIRGQLVPQDPNDEPASVLLERIRAEKEDLIKQGKIKRDKKESIIFKGEDNSYYETIENQTTCIDGEIPFVIPDGWTWCRLKSLAAPRDNSFVDGPFGSNLKTDHYTEEKQVRIIQLNNIGDFEWKNNGVKYTTFEHAETLARCKSYPGDIVIAKMMPAGRAIIIPEIDDVYIISSDCVRLQLPDYIDTQYIMYMINSPTINKNILENVQGIGRTRTSLSKLKEILVPLPPLAHQKRISKTYAKALLHIETINDCNK